jgi:hypothetical protein
LDVGEPAVRAQAGARGVTVDFHYHALSRLVLEEALKCVAVRVQWYFSRHYNIPTETEDALLSLGKALGVDPWTYVR